MKKTTFWKLVTNGAGYPAPAIDWFETKEKALSAYRKAERADLPQACSFSNPARIQQIREDIENKKDRTIMETRAEIEMLNKEIQRRKGEELL